MFAAGATPQTKPGIDELRNEQEIAQRAIDKANHDLAVVQSGVPARFSSGPGKALADDVAAKLAALEDARKNGAVQERLDASSAYNTARAAFDNAKAKFAANDPTAKSAEAALASATAAFEKAHRAVMEADAAALGQKRAAEAAEQAKKTDLYKKSLDAAAHPEKAPPTARVGDETSLSAMQAKEVELLDKTCVLYGAVGVSNYYNFGWSLAKSAYYSLDFVEVDGRGGVGVSAQGYLPRGAGDDLADALIESSKRNARSRRRIRLKVVMPKERYERFGGIMFEIIDWQLLMPDEKTWGPWASEVKEIKRTAPRDDQ